jgi:hypothetical protein
MITFPAFFSFNNPVCVIPFTTSITTIKKVCMCIRHIRIIKSIERFKLF